MSTRDVLKIPSALAVVLAATLTLASTAPAAVLEVEQVIRKEIDGIEGLAGILSIAVSPDGRYVYTASPGDNAIAGFARDRATGLLAFVELQKDGVGGVEGLDGATAIAISPDGASLYVTAERAGALTVFRRNARTGALSFLESHQNEKDGIAGLSYARSVVVSPDGRNVYVAGQHDDGVAVFSRNTTTGSLTYLESEIDGLGGVEGLLSAVYVTITPDGRFVYAAGLNDNAVAVFQRSVASGALTFIEVLKEGANSESFGILGAHTIAVTPDGSHVYVAGQADDAIAAFRRSKVTGTLSFADVAVNGVDDVAGIGGAHGVAVSPDGSYVFATGSSSEALTVFGRDASTGALKYLETHNVSNGTGALACARSVTVSPDGKNVYAAGASSNAISVFRVTGE